jgi:hypothetical protein
VIPVTGSSLQWNCLIRSADGEFQPWDASHRLKKVLPSSECRSLSAQIYSRGFIRAQHWSHFCPRELCRRRSLSHRKENAAFCWLLAVGCAVVHIRLSRCAQIRLYPSKGCTRSLPTYLPHDYIGVVDRAGNNTDFLMLLTECREKTHTNIFLLTRARRKPQVSQAVGRFKAF